MRLLCAALLVFQQPASDSGFLRAGDGRLWLGAAAATAVTSIYDERIARWIRQPAVQGSATRHARVESATWVNEVPLSAAALATWGVGRLTHSRTVADVGLHALESLAATEVVAEVTRSALGRARPRASQNDAFNFSPGAGVNRFENRSFPSLHAAVAFATAASLVEEVRARRPERVKVAAPLLYAAALIPGFTRLYLDQHWASDVVAGAFLGWYLGSRVTRYAHGRRTHIDRALLGLTVTPLPAGGVGVGWQWEPGRPASPPPAARERTGTHVPR